MERHLLITVSDQVGTQYGVRFVGSVFSNKQDLRLTLFYTAARPPAVFPGERTLEDEARRDEQSKEYKAKGRKAMDAAVKELTRSGFQKEQILHKLQTRQFSKVMDIVQEAEKGLYDAVVLGRRGLSWLEHTFDESVTQGILDIKVNFPLWICRKPDLNRKDILVCVDGSEPSYRMVDHIGFMLAKEERHKVHLLSVQKPGGPENPTLEEWFSKCRELLSNNEFPLDRVTTRVVKAGNVVKAIMKEANQVAVVAVGRTGTGQGLLGKIFMGSVSDALCKEMEGAVLWCTR